METKKAAERSVWWAPLKSGWDLELERARLLHLTQAMLPSLGSRGSGQGLSAWVLRVLVGLRI